MDLNKLEEALEQDRLCHIDMIDCIRRGFAQVEKWDERGVLLYNTGCNQYHLTAKDPSFLGEAVALCRPGRTLVCHQEEYVPQAVSRLGLNRMDFYHGVYSHSAPPPQRGEEPVIRT